MRRRDATAHGARLVSRYDALSLYEVQETGALEPTLRSGDDLGPQLSQEIDQGSARRVLALTPRAGVTDGDYDCPNLS